MGAKLRWGQCIVHSGSGVGTFLIDHLGRGGGRCLLIGGAGFDPRCIIFARILSEQLKERLDVLFLRERRPKPSEDLVQRADNNVLELQKIIANLKVADIQVLASEDGAVIGGRRATEAVEGFGLDTYEDLVLDLSALSVGISFPIARLLLDRALAKNPNTNLHLVVASNSQVDGAIRSTPGDAVDPVHGFSGDLDLEESEDDAKIWIPALAPGKGATLQTIRDQLRGPVVVCPILPISERQPRVSDSLIAEFESELYQSWEVPASNLVYAIEDDPLDLYRTISAIYERYTGAFHKVAKSHLILTPSGSKTFAIGALMAAIEHNLPVRYLEAVAYEVDWQRIDQAEAANSRLIHVWLSGAAYPRQAAE